MQMVSFRRQPAAEVFIRGTGQTSFIPSHRATTSTPDLLFTAAQAAVDDAGLTFADIDGLGIASFTSSPDHSIDYAVRWNVQPRWLMDSALGGASGIDLLSHATAAISSGMASTILLVAGDHFEGEQFTNLVRNYNKSATQDFRNIVSASPNAFFALLTHMQMEQYGLTRQDYGYIAMQQRAWAQLNPKAAHRTPLSIGEYLTAPMIAEPLGRYDCVPVVSGALALVVSGSEGSVRILGVQAHHNFDSQNGNGLTTGLSIAVPRLFAEANRAREEVDVVSVYDDYPAMVVAQLMDCELVDRTSPSASLLDLLTLQHPAINSSGGQLSAGQAGAGAGMQGLVEVCDALRDRGPKPTHGAQLGLVTGYGMVTYRYGSCANACLLGRK